MPSAAWKRFEREVCRALGAQRAPSVGPGGFARGSDDDGTGYFAIEAKLSKRGVPEGAWIAQAKRNAGARNWLLVVGRPRSPVRNAVAVIDFGVLLALVELAGVIVSQPKGDRMTATPYDQETPEPPTEPPPEEAPTAPDDESDASPPDEGDEGD